MSASVKPAADLYAVLAQVTSSAIRISGPRERPAGQFANWEKDRKSAHVDALILAWIASHVPGPAHHGRLH
jgi:hypothetical protein